jgi:hypothetical protein
MAASLENRLLDVEGIAAGAYLRRTANNIAFWDFLIPFLFSVIDYGTFFLPLRRSFSFG